MQDLITVIDRQVYKVIQTPTGVTVVVPPPMKVVYLAQQGLQGPPGADGADGAQGPPGPGGDTTYTHDQAVPATTWTINHNLNRYPSVTVVDSANEEVEGETVYVSANTIECRFNSAFSGKAYLN